jgi:hypothetical protein
VPGGTCDGRVGPKAIFEPNRVVEAHFWKRYLKTPNSSS